MHIKRPMCLFAAVFAGLLILYQLTAKPVYRECGWKEEKASFSGILEKREQKNGHLIYHLKDISIPNQIKDQRARQISGQNSRKTFNAGGEPQNTIFDENGRKCRLLCYISDEYLNGDMPAIGQKVIISGIPRDFRKAENEGQFDELTYYRKMGYLCRITNCRIEGYSGRRDMLAEKLTRIKENTSEYFCRHMKGENGRVLSAVLLGKKDMDEEIKDLYRNAGIAHILAISGLHVSLIGLTIYTLLRKAGLFPLLCFALSMILITLYGLMAGAGSSVVRASVMLMLKLLSDVCNRTYDLLTAMSLSGLMLLTVRSEYLTDAGFLLSFLAVLGIAVIYEPLYDMLSSPALAVIGKLPIKSLRQGCFSEKPLKAISVSLAASLMTVPVLLWFYYEYPLYSVLLNLILVPLLPLILISGILGGVIRLSFLLFPADVVLSLYEAVCAFFTKLPASTLLTGRVKPQIIIVYYLLLLFFVLTDKADHALFRKKERKEKRIRLIRGILLFAALLMLFLPVKKNPMIDMLSVGQGDCIVISDGAGHTVICDGGSSDVVSAGKYRLIPYLKYNGIGRIDAVFISHPHADHYNALTQLMSLSKAEKISIGAVYVSSRYDPENEGYARIIEAAGQADIPIRILECMDEPVFGKIKIKVVYPLTELNADDENDDSMVLMARLNGMGILLTGDITSNADDELIESLQKCGIEKADCLKVCHHGSKYSNSDRLLEYLKPDTAIISCSADSKYGHPHQEVIERLDRIGCKSYITSKLGQIKMICKEKGYQISHFPF